MASMLFGVGISGLPAMSCGCDGGGAREDGDADDPSVEDVRPEWEIGPDLPVDIPEEIPPGWVVFRRARDLAALPMSANLLVNPDFEAGDATTIEGWNAYEEGYAVDTSEAHSPGRSARLRSASDGESHGLYQGVTLNQTEPRPLYFGGWSRADGVSGEENGDYSIYIDITYDDDTNLFGQTVEFAVGDHDWTWGEAVIVPQKPIRSLSVYLLLRRTHSGTAWFDDLTLNEIQAGVHLFDGQMVYTEPMSPYPFEGSSLSSVGSPAGVTIELTSAGGAVASVATPAGSLSDPGSEFASGFFLRDAAYDSDYIHPGGTVTEEAGGTLALDAVDLDLALALHASFDGSAGDRISVDGTVTDLTGLPRAVSVYFALPIAVEGWTWGKDIRTQEVIPTNGETATTVNVTYGARGAISRYPYASVAGTDGLLLAYPLDHPAAVRLVANAGTRQFYMVFDVALSPVTKQPGQARFKAVIGRHDPSWGFRAAVQAYADLFPAFFEKRVEEEGLWVAFSDLSPVAGIADFGIVFHELGGLSQVAFDDGAGIVSMRYITEPWSYWMDMPESVPNDDYARVIEVLEGQLSAPEEYRRRYAEATMSSGIHDEEGLFFFEPAAEPWCPYGAVFTLNADPDIADPGYPLNKGNLAWNDDARAAYADPSAGVLDGEYIDSLEARADMLDFRESHLAAADYPLVFDAVTFRPAVPEMLATYEFARWLGEEIHGMGKLMMANGALYRYAFPAHVFDVMGSEVNWLYSGAFTPERDDTFNYRRTMSYRKPYCLLMNTDFNQFTHEMVESYFRTTLFYGVYPSMFSHNASEDRYWDDPALYDRDRDLFVFYVPLIRTLGEAGWEPVTGATSSDAEVYVERYGGGETLHVTTRNVAGEERTYVLTLSAAEVGLTPGTDVTFEDLLTGTTVTAAAGGDTLTLTDTLAPQGVRMFHPR